MYEKIKDESYNNLGGINVKASEYITGQNQFLDIRNYSFERPNALYSRHGTSDYITLPVSTYSATVTSLYQHNQIDYRDAGFQSLIQNNSFLVFDNLDKVYFTNGSTFFTVAQSLSSGLPYTFESNLNNQLTGDLKTYLFMANGDNFNIYGQSLNGSNWAFPTAINTRFPICPSISAFGLTTGFGFSPVGAIPSGTHAVKVYLGKKFINDITRSDTWFYAEASDTAYYNLGATVASDTVYAFTVDCNVPIGYGYSTVVIGYKGPLDSDFAFSNPVIANQFESPVKEIQNGTGTQTVVFKHFTTSYGITTLFDPTITPKYITNYKNMLFQAGYSSAPSKVRHSDLGNFLFSKEEYFLDIKPGEGNEITGMIKFQDTLIVFKDKSCYEVSGDSPETLSVKTTTEEYGCVNHRAAVTFDNKLWFVDRDGICEYNGPNTFYVHYPVEDFFRSLDSTKIRAMHIKADNQVWFFADDTGLVYDYDEKAWTIYDKLPINNQSGAAIIEIGQSLPTPMWYQSGTSYAFFTQLDRSVTTDRGNAITLIAKTRYHKRLGDSTTELWRRVFFDANSVTTGITVTIQAMPNYADGVSATRYTDLGQFQSRVEMGVPAKSCAIKFILQSDHRVTFNGYTIESRYLRNV